MSFATNSNGGEYKHTLSISEIPNHRHKGLDIDNTYCFGWDEGTIKGMNFYKFAFNYMGNTGNRITTGYEGGSTSHNNIQPYLVVYFWKRVS